MYEQCRALNRHGEPCWRPALADPVVPGIHLCWSHLAQLVIDTRRNPTTSDVQKAVRRGKLRLVAANDS